MVIFILLLPDILEWEKVIDISFWVIIALIVWIISNEKNAEIIKVYSKKYQNIKLKI